MGPILYFEARKAVFSKTMDLILQFCSPYRKIVVQSLVEFLLFIRFYRCGGGYGRAAAAGRTS